MIDIAGHACVIAAVGADPVEQLRTAPGASVVMVIGPALDTTTAAMARAAVPAVALERAPATRINAIMPDRHGDQATIDRAATFLHRSIAITGQILELS